MKRTARETYEDGAGCEVAGEEGRGVAAGGGEREEYRRPNIARLVHRAPVAPSGSGFTFS